MPQEEGDDEMHKSNYTFENQVDEEANRTESHIGGVMRVEDIKVNDGLMRVGIKGTVLKVEKGLK